MAINKPLHQIKRPLSQVDLKAYRHVLENLQGNILKGHGRDNTIHVFVEFRAGKQAAARKWLAAMAGDLTSMTQQLEEAHEYSEYQIPGSLFRGIYLTAAAYRYLGLDTKRFDSRFQAGMKKSRATLADPDVSAWEKPYQGALHAMVLLADDGETFIGRAARELVNQIKVRKFARVVSIERGTAQRNVHGKTIEHFGYVDGRSQPLMLKRDIEKELNSEHLRRFADWDPAAGPKLALVEDPHGAKGACGSYVVFRKLEQNVRAFKKREKDLAIALGLMAPPADVAGAMAVGRFVTGNPVVLDHEAGPPTDPSGTRIVRNDFSYRADPQGAKCPFHSHIRKTNPRGSSGHPLSEEKLHRVVRRGITYGDRTRESFEDPDRAPEKGVGLLFMCFQSNIAQQFEFMQATWANNVGFPGARTGLDTVIGQGGKGGQLWPRIWGNADPKLREPFDFAGFVSMKGGEYFFAPSITFFAGLAK